MTTVFSRYRPSSKSHYSRNQSITVMHKSENIQKYQSSNTEGLNHIPKKYLYFHEQKIEKNQRKMSFPYNAYSLCYFQNRFENRKIQRTKKPKDFNTNISIRNFLNSKLNTQPVELNAISKNDSHFIDKKLKKQINKIRQLEDLQVSTAIQDKDLQKNNRQNSNFVKIKPFPKVFKIKSKKAYFQSRFKNTNHTTENSSPQMKISAKKMKTDEETPHQSNLFQHKYRSRTEDNINMISLMREQIKKRVEKNIKKGLFGGERQNFQDSLDPWESNQAYMQTSVKF